MNRVLESISLGVRALRIEDVRTGNGQRFGEPW